MDWCNHADTTAALTSYPVTETPPLQPTPEPTDLPTPLPGFTDTTITYTYDPLYRLTAADYFNGDYYHYAYDSVGNRLTQESMVSNQSSVTSYQYDDANRLVDVNGVPYTWDNNGNLLIDGVNAYAYDSANRLTALSGQQAINYAYNGLGDRLQESVDGLTTTFRMDLNTGLTQALSDGTDTYLYGLERIAQVNGEAEYFLGDALGSVRQMTDEAGQVTYLRAYDPYGVVRETGGTGQTEYGFTNEYISQGLVYLRARYYSSATGRFLTRDTWDGDINSPMSYNPWNYVQSNPVNYIDPTGQMRWECWGENQRLATAEKYVPVAPGDPMTTYTAAGIAVQCWGGDITWPWKDSEYSGVGIAQITQLQAETCYGERIPDPDDPKKQRGYGLRLPGEPVHNPKDLEWAAIFMRRRIELVTNKCDGQCTSTDIFITAALAQNGPGFTKANMEDLVPKKNRISKEGITIDWYAYFEKKGNVDDTSDQLKLFYKFAKKLHSDKYFLPNDLWSGTIEALIRIRD